MLTRANPLGWSNGEKLLAMQLNDIDEQLPHAIDGVHGGAYTLLAPLSLQGFVTLLGDVELSGNVHGSWAPSTPILLAGAGMRVTAGATLGLDQSSVLEVTDGAKVRVGLGGSVALTDQAAVNVGAGSAITLEDDARIDGVDGSRVNLPLLTVREQLKLQGKLVKDTVDAGIVERVVTLAPMSQGLSTLAADTYVFSTTGMAGDITVTVPDGSYEGQTLRFTQGWKSAAHKVAFSLTTPKGVRSQGGPFSLAFAWDGATWLPVAWTGVEWV